MKAREIAEWISEHYRAEVPTKVDGTAAVGRLASVIGSHSLHWQKTYPELRATNDRPKRYYWAASNPIPSENGAREEQASFPASDDASPLAASRPMPFSSVSKDSFSSSRPIFMLDRAAVLFTGILVGAVLGVSFHTNGKPLETLLGVDEVSAEIRLPAAAPQPQACGNNFPMAPQVIAALRSNHPIRIGVFGDSFGDGLWAGTIQHMRGRPDFEVFQFSKQSTGFTRYASLDLLEDAKKHLDGQEIDIALISFGMNDTQGVWAEGKAAPYMSEPWRHVVGERATALVKMLKERGIAIGWVGLPRMREAKFDHQIQLMNSFYAELMCRLDVPFINPVAETEDANHLFAKELIDSETGKPYIARANDGMHMTVHGYRVLARPLLQRIDLLAPNAEPGSAHKI